MKNKDILTEKEKRFLFLSAKDKLTLSEELEYARFKKEENFNRMKEAERYALTAGVLSAVMLPTIFMPSAVLPIAICLGNLGYLAYMEQTYFKKTQQKAYYYFCQLNADVKDKKYQEMFRKNQKIALKRSNSLFDRAKAVDNISKQLEKLDLDRKNANGYYLKEDYYAIPRFRLEILSMCGLSLIAGAFLPQIAFLCISVGFALLSTILAKVDANTTRKDRYNHWAKKEQQLEQLIYTRSHPFENAQSTVQKIEIKKVAHQQKQKMPDNSRQKED